MPPSTRSSAACPATTTKRHSDLFISYHVINILKERELNELSVVKEYLTTAADAEDIRMLEDLEKSIIENKQKGRE